MSAEAWIALASLGVSAAAGLFAYLRRIETKIDRLSRGMLRARATAREGKRRGTAALRKCDALSQNVGILAAAHDMLAALFGERTGGTTPESIVSQLKTTQRMTAIAHPEETRT